MSPLCLFQWLKEKCLPSIEEQHELDQENQRMEWRLREMERQLAERDQWRETKRQLEKSKHQVTAQQRQLDEFMEELSVLKLHNQQVCCVFVTVLA